ILASDLRSESDHPHRAINASAVSLRFTPLARHIGEELLDQPVGRRRLLPHHEVAGVFDLVVAHRRQPESASARGASSRWAMVPPSTSRSTSPPPPAPSV